MNVTLSITNLRSTLQQFLLWLFILLPGLAISAQDSITVQLKWKHAFQFAGHYAAVERGFYKEAGLEVTLVEGGPETNFAHELITGKCHYAVALSSMLIHRNEGKPLVALAAILQHSPEVLLVPGSSGINTPHQMAGRTVAASPEDTPALLAMFKNEGLAADAVKTIPYEFSPEKMLSGEIAGMGAYSINEPFQLQKLGIPYRLIQPRDYGVDFYGDCLFTTEDEIARHPKRVRAFLEATLKGWQYAMSHRVEIIDLLKGRYHCPLSREALNDEADQMALLMFSELIDIGHMNEGRWRHIGDTYVRLGMLAPGYSLDGFLYDREPKTDLAWLLWTLGGTIGSTLLLGGIVLGLIRVNNRITNAERQARESQAMLQTVINTIPVGVFWKDRDSRILGCNQVFAGYAGLGSPQQAQGLTADRLPWKDDAQDEVTEEQVIQQGRSILLSEKSLTSPSGSTRHFYQSKVPLKNELGDIIGLLSVIEDITSLKAAEEHQTRLKDRLLQSQKYESLHRLANGVCHHSNNILQALTSYAELARLQTPPGQTREFMDGVLRESQRVAALNRVLLTCTGHGLHQFEETRLRAFMDESLPTLKCCLPSTHELEWQHDGPEVIIHADRESLRHLLINLLTNASEATEGSGTVYLRTGTLLCDAAYLQDSQIDPAPDPGEYLYLDIIDTGKGMSPEVLQMVFDPFFSTKFTGRGLGMAATLGIIKSHHGALKIQSAPNQGTTVRALLPVLKK
ncbi:PAS domain S-box-containing protein [Prosthecobacter fusiformis]|uniref:histidine kinase n=1 Tax=Prosthecobacter fusiformis TaxID=48464 RepID=A0A4R7RZD4_9BACT|nr:ABC transporter substrate-binding protein [Prosthecobacter fusiformis]TDU71320.1 PAS domain S-box-containing protein [Prosthecobacter fusiformis]